MAEYTAREYLHATKFRTGLITLKLPKLEEPKKPDLTNILELELWKIQVREYRAKIKSCGEKISQIISLILGQDSELILH